MRILRNLPRLRALLPLAFLSAAALPAQANVFISTQPTSNMSCSGGVCAPTAQPANMNTTDLAHMLASSDVTVMSGSDTNRREIVVKSMFGWASTHRLTLDANYAVEIDAPIIVHGPGALTVTHHIFPGTLSFGPGGHVAFWDLSSSVVLNGTAYTLVGDIGGLASAIATNSTGHFALAGDVKPTTVYGASPVPTTFNGVLEGLGNRILYLRINDTAANQYDGLFANIGPYGGVLDLGLVNAKVQGISGSRIGTFAGESDGEIVRSYATGIVLHTGSGGYLGGMVGWNTGGITYSHSEASVRGQQNVSAGGIAGGTDINCCRATGIDYSRASGDVTGGNGSSVGGLVGTNLGSIGLSQASGKVTAGSGSFAGGLVGQGHGGYVAVFATGAVKVGNLGTAGGLQGRLDSRGETDSYATGSVTGGARSVLGSLFGECCNSATYPMYHGYGIGAVSGGPQSTIGGVVGHDDGLEKNWLDVYWDTDTTGVGNLSQGAGNIVNDPGIAGLSDVQFKAGLPPGFSGWGQNSSINNGYPYLPSNPPQ